MKCILLFLMAFSLFDSNAQNQLIHSSTFEVDTLKTIKSIKKLSRRNKVFKIFDFKNLDFHNFSYQIIPHFVLNEDCMNWNKDITEKNWRECIQVSQLNDYYILTKDLKGRRTILYISNKRDNTIYPIWTEGELASKSRNSKLVNQLSSIVPDLEMAKKIIIIQGEVTLFFNNELHQIFNNFRSYNGIPSIMSYMIEMDKTSG